MVENFVPDTADEHEAGKIGQADPKQGGMAEANVSDLEDAIADVVKHQEDKAEGNVFEREVTIVDDVHHRENVPARVDTTAEEIVR